MSRIRGSGTHGERGPTRAQQQIATALERSVRRNWPGGVIPPTEGGPFFRALAERLGCQERALSQQARRAGYWPWTPVQVVQAFGEREAQQRTAGLLLDEGELPEGEGAAWRSSG